MLQVGLKPLVAFVPDGKTNHEAYNLIFHRFLSTKYQRLHLTHWPNKITEQRVRGWYINSPDVSISQMIAVSLTFKIELLSLFYFFFFYKKAYKKQVICYCIAVKNACFCWVTECIAPSIHALTARIATALLMWGVLFVFCSPYVNCFMQDMLHTSQLSVKWEICDQSEQFFWQLHLWDYNNFLGIFYILY